MNKCSNKKCNKELFKHNLFCYKCGFKSTKPITNNIRPMLKRMTHIYCHSCMKCIEMYSDDFCRSCGIKHLCYNEREEVNYYFLKNDIKKHIKKNEICHIKKNEISQIK